MFDRKLAEQAASISDNSVRNVISGLAMIAEAQGASKEEMKNYRRAEIIYNAAATGAAAAYTVWKGEGETWYKIAMTAVALAGIGTLTAGQLAQVNSMADGGIVPGFRQGDRNQINVNGGELVLNNQDQVGLLNMIRGSRNGMASGGGGNVFHIDASVSGGGPSFTTGDARRLQREQQKNIAATIKNLVDTGRIPAGIVTA